MDIAPKGGITLISILVMLNSSYSGESFSMALEKLFFSSDVPEFHTVGREFLWRPTGVNNFPNTEYVLHDKVYNNVFSLIM